MSRSLVLLLAVAAFWRPTPARGAEVDPDVVGTGEEPSAPPVQEPPAPPAEEPPAPRPPRATRDDAGDEEDAEDNWLDVSHAFIERRIFAPVVRIDRFFSDERDLEAERSRSFIRWRNDLRLEEGEVEPTYTTGLSATLQVPGLRKQLRRLRIEIAGQTRDAAAALFPEEDETTGEAASDRIGSADAGLGLRIWDTLTAHASLGAGVLVRLPPGAYGRLRFRSALPLGRRVLSRQALTGFWRTDTRFGTTGSAEIERPLSRVMIARLFGTGTLTEVSRGVEWTGDLAVLATYDVRTGAVVGAAVNGTTDPLPGVPDVERYRIYTRLRQGFYRNWIFFELEPEYAWPWTPERGRHASWGLTFRLEVQFRGNEAVAAPRAPAPPQRQPHEPPDPGP